ncbi:hypothetical protein ACFWAT_13985 [Streptomyces syringium]|uniref:hypothetical protein n=1 Tax=Streptomyces syringium TaxID=76729 RepID=UPI00364D200C
MTRPRALAFAAACALTFLLATPGSASAALGDFFYTYTDADGVEQRQKVTDPDIPNRQCHNVKEAEDPATTKPAHSPVNETDTNAYVFSDIDCDGTAQVLALGGGRGGVNLKFRSFLFQD